MTVKDLERIYDYGYWANRKLFNVISQLTREQFTQEVAGSYGSIRNTLVHTLSAEWGWLERCGGAAHGSALKAADYPTLQARHVPGNFDILFDYFYYAGQSALA